LETRRAGLERVDGIENQLSDPGEKDWEENAITKEGDDMLAVVGNATETEIREMPKGLLVGGCTVTESQTYWG